MKAECVFDFREAQLHDSVIGCAGLNIKPGLQVINADNSAMKTSEVVRWREIP